MNMNPVKYCGAWIGIVVALVMLLFGFPPAIIGLVLLMSIALSQAPASF